MSDGRWAHRVAALKDVAPRGVKDVANRVTRTYGVATARWRPYPDFLIVGTKRGGTTSLWNYLLRHPQVQPMFPSPRGLKSNGYFFENLDRGDRWYRSHFHTTAHRRWREHLLGRTVTGEASPYYMLGPHIPRLIARDMPQVRLIVLLRDPIERAYGHYQERAKQGVEPLSFEDALDAEASRLSGEWQRMTDDPTYYSTAYDFFSYRERGVYLPQMRRIFASFPRQQVLVLRSEDLYADAQGVFDDTCRFLEITPLPIRERKQHNYIPRAPIPAGVKQQLATFYSPHNQALYDYLARDFGWTRPSD